METELQAVMQQEFARMQASLMAKFQPDQPCHCQDPSLVLDLRRQIEALRKVIEQQQQEKLTFAIKYSTLFRQLKTMRDSGNKTSVGV